MNLEEKLNEAAEKDYASPGERVRALSNIFAEDNPENFALAVISGEEDGKVYISFAPGVDQVSIPLRVAKLTAFQILAAIRDIEGQQDVQGLTKQ